MITIKIYTAIWIMLIFVVAIAEKHDPPKASAESQLGVAVANESGYNPIAKLEPRPPVEAAGPTAADWWAYDSKYRCNKGDSPAALWERHRTFQPVIEEDSRNKDRVNVYGNNRDGSWFQAPFFRTKEACEKEAQHWIDIDQANKREEDELLKKYR
jgi:hypothetical protein